MIVKIHGHHHGGSTAIIDMCDPEDLAGVHSSLHFFDKQDFMPALQNFLNHVGGGWGSAEIEWDQRDRDTQIKECLKAIKDSRKAYQDYR